MPERKLTAKQIRFVEEYIINLNAADAARRAGYATKRAGEYGYALLQKPTIQAALKAAQRARSARTGVTQDRVVTELAQIAFADPRRVMSWGPDGVVLRDSDSLSEAEAKIVSEVSETGGPDSRAIKLKLVDKLGAMEKLARHIGLYDGGGSTADASDMSDEEIDAELAKLEEEEAAGASQGEG